MNGNVIVEFGPPGHHGVSQIMGLGETYYTVDNYPGEKIVNTIESLPNQIVGAIKNYPVVTALAVGSAYLLYRFLKK